MRRTPLTIALMLLPGIVWGWPPEGLRVTGAISLQAFSKMTGDGLGGAFISWADFRDFPNRNDLYVQRVTADGRIAPGWLTDGVAVSAGKGTQAGGWDLRADSEGGVLLAFDDTRDDFGDVYLQRITGGGAVAPGWPVNGVPLAVGPGRQSFVELVSDGAGGAFVAWQHEASSPITPAYYTHVLGSGTVAPGWPGNGRLFEPGSQVVVRPLMLALPEGGFLACWSVSDDTLRHARILAQRFTPDGEEHPAWPAGGAVVCESRPNHRVIFDRLVSDGAGGVFMVFFDGRAGDDDLYAQHVLADGSIAPGWPADGLPVSAAPGVVEQNPVLCEDGAGGVHVAWEDYRENYPRVFSLHLRGDGTRAPGWPVGGLPVSGPLEFQVNPQVARDRGDGVHIAWVTISELGYRSRIQHLRGDGFPALGWPVGGRPVIALPTDQDLPVVVSDGAGGAIVSWSDIRESAPGVNERDVYAMRHADEVVVAAQASVVEAVAEADHVRVRWQVSGSARATVEREAEGAGWSGLNELVADGRGEMALEDRDVRAGERYGYRLRFADGTRAGATSITVPRPELSLEGARPNPAVGAVSLAFTLPDASPARLALYDAAGRRLADRVVQGAGRQLVRLAEATTLAPGLYWAVLTRGRERREARLVVTR